MLSKIDEQAHGAARRVASALFAAEEAKLLETIVVAPLEIFAFQAVELVQSGRARVESGAAWKELVQRLVGGDADADL